MGKTGVSEEAGGGLSRDAIVDAALELLDRQGFKGLGLSRVAARLDADDAIVRRHFPRRRDLLAAVLDAMAQRVAPPAAAEDGWRGEVRRRATYMRDVIRSRRDGALVAAQAVSGPFLLEHDQGLHARLATEGISVDAAAALLAIVHRFTLGWEIANDHGGGGGALRDDVFDAGLDAILTGFAAGAPVPVPAQAEPDTSAPGEHWLFRSLWTVLRNARESADLTYSSVAPLNELDRRILLLLKSQGPLVPAELSASIGLDKGQVSRAVKRLEDVAAIEREGVRKPLHLSPAGDDLAERMMALADARNRELTDGIGDDDLVDFFTILEQLTERAMQLYEQERRLASGRTDDAAAAARLDDEPVPLLVVERGRIIPPLFTLFSYVMRGAALAFKRRTNLSNFEAWVLTEIARGEPLAWPRLVQVLDRDRSQASRTTHRLIDLALVARSGPQGRRNGAFSLTREGRTVYAVINRIALERSDYLMRDLAPDPLRTFLAAFELVMANCEAQVKALKENSPAP